eukprot:scaffold1770_cov375-Prasinococcus_capsulatus_cf.AAC.1
MPHLGASRVAFAGVAARPAPTTSRGALAARHGAAVPAVVDVARAARGRRWRLVCKAQKKKAKGEVSAADGDTRSPLLELSDAFESFVDDKALAAALREENQKLKGTPSAWALQTPFGMRKSLSYPTQAYTVALLPVVWWGSWRHE